MYICRQCKTEYNSKIDFCDCGNNTFECVENGLGKNELSAEETLKLKSEILSWAFLSICVLLSIIIIFI
ncbi:MAG: hypothetical protein R3Y28_07640 [Candidatus Gastranaerophilales bacterium]